MLISEIFLSIQGESTYAGMPCVFVRLGGCNMRCAWCDTGFARDAEGAVEMSVDDVVREVRKIRSACSLAEITGGEPLLQPETLALVSRLLDDGFDVLIETNGSMTLAGIDGRAVKIVDVKCPSSAHVGSFLMENLDYITPQDEIKFVIADRNDYEFAVKFIGDYLKDACSNILFAPVKSEITPARLAEWILKDGLRVRLQLQIHKYIWADEKGR